jgi:HK97 family phage prohead protease
MDQLNCGLIELKFDSSGTDAPMSFTGYGAVFNNVDAGGDMIEPGAFAAFLSDVKAGKKDWPAMMSQHGAMGLTAEDLTPIGVWTDFAEDGHGLKVAGQFADTPRGREMYTLMKMTPRPAINGLSIGYIAKESIPRSSPDEPRRRLKRIDLIEVSPVTRPMNGKARVESVKSIETLLTLNEAEDYLKSFGLSKTQAVAFISRVKGIGLGNPEGSTGGPGDPDADLAEVIRKAIPGYRK